MLSPVDVHRIWKILLSVGVIYSREGQMPHRIWKIFLFVGVIYCRESQMPHRIIRNQQSDGIISAKKPRSQEAKKPRSQEAKKPRNLSQPIEYSTTSSM